MTQHRIILSSPRFRHPHGDHPHHHGRRPRTAARLLIDAPDGAAPDASLYRRGRNGFELVCFLRVVDGAAVEGVGVSATIIARRSAQVSSPPHLEAPRTTDGRWIAGVIFTRLIYRTSASWSAAHFRRGTIAKHPRQRDAALHCLRADRLRGKDLSLRHFPPQRRTTRFCGAVSPSRRSPDARACGVDA